MYIYIQFADVCLSYKKFSWAIFNDARDFILNGTLLIFSTLLSRIALMLLGAATLSALDNIVSV